MNTRRKYLTEMERQKAHRATMLLCEYNRADKRRNRGKGDLTTQWIVDNIFSKPCAHCGKTGWEVIGCNRLDNSKPHTKDNVEPCCSKCNNDLSIESHKKQIYQYTLDGELVRIWATIKEAAKNINKVYDSGIVNCCKGKIKTAGGYIFSYKPL